MEHTYIRLDGKQALRGGREHEAVNALIHAVDEELKAFKQKRLKEYHKEYYAKPANRQRRNNYNKQYQQMLKLKKLK